MAIQTTSVASTARTESVGPKVGIAVMKQPKFKWDMEDKYNELQNFRLEGNDIFRSYNMPDIEKIAIIKKFAR